MGKEKRNTTFMKKNMLESLKDSKQVDIKKTKCRTEQRQNTQKQNTTPTPKHKDLQILWDITPAQTIDQFKNLVPKCAKSGQTRTEKKHKCKYCIIKIHNRTSTT